MANVFLILLVALMVVAFSALGGLIVMFVFNLVAPIFWATAPVLTFFQGWGLSVALTILGGFFRGKK